MRQWPRRFLARIAASLGCLAGPLIGPAFRRCVRILTGELAHSAKRWFTGKLGEGTAKCWRTRFIDASFLIGLTYTGKVLNLELLTANSLLPSSLGESARLIHCLSWTCSSSMCENCRYREFSLFIVRCRSGVISGARACLLSCPGRPQRIWMAYW